MSQESAYFKVENIVGKHDVKDIKRRLDTIHGVQSVAVNAQTSLVSVDYDSSGTSYDQIENTLNKMGYQIIDDHSRINTR